MFLSAGCTSLKLQSFEDISVSLAPEDDKIAFVIENTSDKEILLPSLSKYYLEVLSGEQWERVHYTPCPCGAPCARPIPKKLTPGEKTSIYWNYLYRKCSGRESEEKTMSSGKFRLRLNYQVLEGEKIAKSEKVWVEFKR